MKKLVLILALVVVFSFSATAVFAQPFTGTMGSDSYGVPQGGGNILSVATPKDDNDNGPDINDAINLLLGSSHAQNSDVDFLRWTNQDESWFQLSNTGANSTYSFIGLSAGSSNTLGVYPVGDPTDKTPVLGPYTGFGFSGAGTLASPFPAYTAPYNAGNFGWYLDSQGGSLNTWYSDPIENDFGYDHMLTYYLPSIGSLNGIGLTVQIDKGSGAESYTFYDPYLLVWEDDPWTQFYGTVGDEDYDDMMFVVDRVRPLPEPISMLLFGSGLFGLIGLRRKQG